MRLVISGLNFLLVNSMIPKGHTPFSWTPMRVVSSGHTMYSAGFYQKATVTGRSCSFIDEPSMDPASGDSVLDFTLRTNLITEGNKGEGFKQCFPAHQPIPSVGDEGFSVLSYNVLIPNSQDGWWVYKNYQQHVPSEHRTWAHRAALLENQLLTLNADIVCIQEASGGSFESDFCFMKNAGYDSLVHDKGRMRQATFWKTATFDLIVAAQKHRFMVTAFSDKRETHFGQKVFVGNCHLSAGPNPELRLRQMFEGVDHIRKEINRMKGGGQSLMQSIPIVLCGDFNAENENAVKEFLIRGQVTALFREPEFPNVQITSKTKKNPFKFKDAYQQYFKDNQFTRPFTYYAPPLTSKFLDESSGQMTGECKEAIKNMFLKFSASGTFMNKEEVHQWLVTINGEVGRGSEFRKAMALFSKNKADELSLEDLESIYMAELEGGKFWGVEFDLNVCHAGFGEWSRPFQAVFDYLYFSGDLELVQALPTVTQAQLTAITEGDCIPNSWHPSDHLPVASLFKYRPMQCSEKSQMN